MRQYGGVGEVILKNDSMRGIIQNIVQVLVREYQPDRIILFGSYAYGQPDGQSDVDLLIIKNTERPFHKRWAEVCRLVSDLRRGVPFSPFVITPEELEKRLALRDPFFQEILEKGEMLYVR
jgi:predicted nucleotidyltransferase